MKPRDHWRAFRDGVVLGLVIVAFQQVGQDEAQDTRLDAQDARLDALERKYSDATAIILDAGPRLNDLSVRRASESERKAVLAFVRQGRLPEITP